MSWGQIFELLAGLSIFLYGMSIFENAIKGMSTISFKNFLEKFTNTPTKSVFSGIFATAILQSSTAVSLIVLAIVGAGLMNVTSAIGVILGGAVGTTFTETLIGLIGLKYSLSALAYPIIAVGGIIRIFGLRNGKVNNIGNFILGFGLLFMGLELTKNSIIGYSASLDLSTYTEYGNIIYLIIGIIVAAMIQSSSGTTIITMTALNGGFINIEMGISLLLGAYIGTTITTLIGSLGGGVIKKQVALAYTIFNISWSIIGFIMLSTIIYIFNEYGGLAGKPLVALSIFHIFYKFIGVILLIPFLEQYSSLIQYIIPEKKASGGTLTIETIGTDIPDLGIIAIKKDLGEIIKEGITFNANIFDIDEDILNSGMDSEDIIKTKKSFSIDELKSKYQELKNKEEKLLSYIVQIREKNLTTLEEKIVIGITNSLMNLIYSCKYLKDLIDSIQFIKGTNNELIENYYIHSQLQTVKLYKKLLKIIHEKYEDTDMNNIEIITNNIKEQDKKFLDSLNRNTAISIQENINLTTLINTSRFIYQSMKTLILSTKELLHISKSIQSKEKNE